MRFKFIVEDKSRAKTRIPNFLVLRLRCTDAVQYVVEHLVHSSFYEEKSHCLSVNEKIVLIDIGPDRWDK